MKGYSYIVARDYGFAPNPFYGICTLATCKPIIRKHCEVGDYVIGLTPRDRERGNRLVYLMKVTEVTTFDSYWSDARFACKKPVMNGTVKKCYGDNIYHHNDNNEWLQEDSHHSNEDGSINEHNLKRDTSTTDRVLVSEDFYYFGSNSLLMPPDIVEQITIGVGQKKLTPEVVNEVVAFVANNVNLKGYLGEPHLFHNFQRYDGIH